MKGLSRRFLLSLVWGKPRVETMKRLPRRFHLSVVPRPLPPSEMSRAESAEGARGHGVVRAWFPTLGVRWVGVG